MSQRYMDTNHRTGAPSSLHGQPRAGVAVLQQPSSGSEFVAPRKADSKPRVAPLGLARGMDRKRFTYALWTSVVLLVAGCALLYRRPAVDGELYFLLGGACIIGAAGLFRAARAALIARLEQQSRDEGLSPGAAQMRADELFDQMLVSKEKYAHLPPESGDPKERVVENLPLA